MVFYAAGHAPAFASINRVNRLKVPVRTELEYDLAHQTAIPRSPSGGRYFSTLELLPRPHVGSSAHIVGVRTSHARNHLSHRSRRRCDVRSRPRWAALKPGGQTM